MENHPTECIGLSTTKFDLLTEENRRSVLRARQWTLPGLPAEPLLFRADEPFRDVREKWRRCVQCRVGSARVRAAGVQARLHAMLFKPKMR